MKHFVKQNAGLTLIELVVAMAIATVVTAAAASVLFFGLRINRQTGDTASQQITVSTLLNTVEGIISEGNISNIEMKTESWKIADANGKVLLSYLFDNAETEMSGAVYVGDYQNYGNPEATGVATPILTGLLSSYVELYDGLFTIHVETKDGMYSSSVYCRTLAPENDNHVSNGDSFITEEEGIDKKTLFMNALKSQYQSRGEIRENGDATELYYSEWYCGGTYWPGWNEKTPWCACYVSWALDKAGRNGPSTNHSGWYANVDEFMGYFKDNQTFKPRNEAAEMQKGLIGNLIFFDWNKGDNPQHMGVVLNVSDDGKWVYTIEGNSAGRVTIRSYSMTDARIIGYGILFGT